MKFETFGESCVFFVVKVSRNWCDSPTINCQKILNLGGLGLHVEYEAICLGSLSRFWFIHVDVKLRCLHECVWGDVEFRFKLYSECLNSLRVQVEVPFSVRS